LKFLFAAVLLALLSVLASAHDLKNLPLGDNLKSSAPEAGHLWPCRIEPDAAGPSVMGRGSTHRLARLISLQKCICREM